VQSCLFAIFTAFWSVLALLLERPPYNLGAAVAGAFGLVGLIGICTASIGGRGTDRFGTQNGVTVGILACAISFVIFYSVRQLVGLIAGVILLDFGIALAQVSNQSLILGLNQDARSRINTIYITTIFFGGAFGSGAASIAWRRSGWSAVSLLGLGVSLLALAIHIYGRHAARSAANVEQPQT
jgi:cyanate permease